METKWQPQGKIIATGEDGVPWELYENGYLLFKPTKEQNTLTNPSPAPSWKEKYGDKIIAIGFTDKVYASKDSSYLFSKYNKNIVHKLTKLQYVETYQVNTSNVLDMSYMFAGAIIKSLDLSRWNTSNVTNMSTMFYGTHSLQKLNISNWDTSNVINMSEMFSYAKSLIRLNISNWDTSNVLNIYAMFYGAIKLQTLNISNWNMSSVENMSYLFYENDNLKLVDCSKIKNPQEITDSFKRLINENKLQLNNDCVIVFPN